MTATRTRRGRAFAPAHVTGVFSPATNARDPRARGSVGAGVVLELGVAADATWRPSGRRRLRLSGDTGSPLPISEEVARRLFAGRSGELTVRLSHDVPIGCGFGTSAAGALAVALAVGRALDVPRPRSVETAHLADLFGGGGLGGVAAILGGGWELRTRAGVPPFGTVEHRRFPSPLFVAVVGGPLPSPRLLRDPRVSRRLEEAEADLAALRERPTLGGFWDASERFTDRVGLAPRGLATTLRGLRRRGARAAQAMFGRTLFASVPAAHRRELVRYLSGRGVSAVELRAASRGARLLPAATLFPERQSPLRP